jgi:hypothetical protein
MNQAPAPTRDTARAPTRSVTICRVVGIPRRVHWTFAFLVGFVLVAAWDNTSASAKRKDSCGSPHSSSVCPRPRAMSSPSRSSDRSPASRWVRLLRRELLFGARMWPPTLFAGKLVGAPDVAQPGSRHVQASPCDADGRRRVLRAVLVRKRSRLGATDAAARVSRVMGTFMVVTGLFFDIWLMVIGLFVLLGSAGEEEAARHPSDDRIEHRDPSP